MDLATIQSLVGHADVDMTKHYLHVQAPVRLGAIAKFDEAFFEKIIWSIPISSSSTQAPNGLNSGTILVRKGTRFQVLRA